MFKESTILLHLFFCTFLQPFLANEDEQYFFKMVHFDGIASDTLKNVEADVHWCFTKFMDKIQDNYTPAQPGIQKKVFQMIEIIKIIDPRVYKHLNTLTQQHLLWAFRWINNMLMRDLPFMLIVRMWDTYLSETESFTTLHVYFCAAFLLKWSDEILKKHDEEQLLTFLQKLPTKEWGNSDVEVLLSQAYVWQTLYSDSPSHIKARTTEITPGNFEEKT